MEGANARIFDPEPRELAGRFNAGKRWDFIFPMLVEEAVISESLDNADEKWSLNLLCVLECEDLGLPSFLPPHTAPIGNSIYAAG